MKKSELLIFLLVISINSFSQFDFKKGFIVTNNNDTIHGLIDNTNPNISSNYCFFKYDSSENVIKYSPNEIKAYGIKDAKLFVSKYITIDDLTEAVFLEYLVDGIIDLYYCERANDDFYFISKNNTLYPLSNDFIDVNENGKRMVRESKRYVGILNWLMSDAEGIKSEIYSTKLSHNSLIELSKNYHNIVCKDEKCVIYSKSQKKSNDAKWQFDFGVVADYVISSMDLNVTLGNFSTFWTQTFYDPNTGQSHLEEKWIESIKITETNAQFQSYIRGIAPGIFLSINRNTRYSLQIQLKYQFMKNSVLEFQMFQVPVLMTYDFIRYKKATPYVLFGVSNDFFAYFKTIEQLYAKYDYLTDVDIDYENYQIIPIYSQKTVNYTDRNILDKKYKPSLLYGIGLSYNLPNHNEIKFGIIGSSKNFETNNTGTIIYSKLHFTTVAFSLSYEF